MYDNIDLAHQNVGIAMTSDPLWLVATSVSNAALVVDQVGVVRFANAAAARLFGRNPKHLLGQPLGLPLTANGTTDIELLRPDGTIRFAELRVTDIVWQDEPAFLATLYDITERKRTEQLLIESQQLLRTTLDELTAQVAILDHNGCIAAVNRAWRLAMARNIAPELCAGPGADYVAVWAALDTDAARAVLNGLTEVLWGQSQQFKIEYPIGRGKDQQWFAIHINRCIENQWGRAVVTLESITERKRAEVFDLARQRVLEVIARQQPLEAVADELFAVTKERYTDLVYLALALNHTIFIHIHDDLDEASIKELDELSQQNAPPSVCSETGDVPLMVAPAPPRLGETACCWRVGLRCDRPAPRGILTLCRRERVQPDADDRRFLTLIEQLLSVAIEQHEYLQQLAFQAHYDTLTGLPNRVLFEDRLRHAMEVARRSQRKVAVLFIDLDRFKQINDTLGHSVGDMLLVQVARRFEGCVRASDTLARRGGDEFMLVLPDIADASQVSRVAQRLHEMLRIPFQVKGHELFLSASIGASLYPDDGEDVETLQRHADVAMYRAKSTLRNSFQFFDPSAHRTALERLRLENQLRRAIERNELEVFYQPQLDRNGRLAAVEALLRWNHPDRGLIGPGQFIPMAEEIGLIVAIGEWCLREVGHQLVQWKMRGLAPVPVAINISALQFIQPSFVSIIADTIKHNGLAPGLLELELTESMLLGDLEDLVRRLDELRALGVTLAIDDFGRGYSALAYLQRLPITTLKVDRNFVAALDGEDDRRSWGIVQAIVTLGRALNLRLVAEGVETEAQYRLLYELGCDRFQGFYFYRPMPANQFEPLLPKAPGD